MTFAEFVAVCFWPVVILFAILFVIVKEQAVFRFVAVWAVGIGILYLGLWVFYSQSSIIAVVDAYVLAGVLGFAIIRHGYDRWGKDKRGHSPQPWKERLAVIGLLVIGAGLVWISASTLFSDFFRPRLVLEGRVDNLRTRGRRPDHLADIAGRTVKVTTPVYERLKFKPYVRAEVGQGSNYVFEIEYLAN